MTKVTRSPWLRGLLTVLALVGSPLVVLAEQAQCMAVLGKPTVVVGARETGADATAYCIDFDRDTPTTTQDLSAYTGDATVEVWKGGKWQGYGSLQDAIDNRALTIRGTNGFDSIRIEKVGITDTTAYRVKFNGDTLFGADAADVKGGTAKMEALGVLRDFVHSDPKLNKAAVQQVYWALEKQGKADAASMREVVAKLKEDLKRLRDLDR